MKKTTGKNIGKPKLQPPVALIGEKAKSLQQPVGEKLAPPVREISRADYGRLLADVKERVRSAQYEALRTVNRELVALYRDIGRMIVERLSDAIHGDAIVEQLAKDLRDEFPGIAGFSRRNMFYMREFYLAYRDAAKVQPLVAQIAWSIISSFSSVARIPSNASFTSA